MTAETTDEARGWPPRLLVGGAPPVLGRHPASSWLATLHPRREGEPR